MARLNSCEHGDCIVVYNGIDCPLCVAESTIENLEIDIQILENN